MKNFKAISILSLLISLTFLMIGCQSKYKYAIEKSDHGLTIHQDSTIIKIEVINESIINVNKMKVGSEPSTIPDYVTVLEPQDVKWNIKEDKELLTVSTTALNVFVNRSVLTYVTNTSLYIFGQNDIALRLPFIIFYILSVILMYKITDKYFTYERDRLISICIFMLLPGVLSASLLVNSAIIVTFLTLLYLYYYKKTNNHSYLLLCLFVFIDNSFAILFLALFFYSIKSLYMMIILRVQMSVMWSEIFLLSKV